VPRSSAKFQFEWKMMSWAIHLSEMLAGENRCFLLTTDADGAVRQLLIGEDEYQYDQETWGVLMQSRQCWLFYHPFDGPVYTYMEWQSMERSTIERLMGKGFEEADFIEMGHPGSQRTKSEPMEFPSSWRVMF
jgi:hypothetical protein